MDPVRPFGHERVRWGSQVAIAVPRACFLLQVTIAKRVTRFVCLSVDRRLARSTSLGCQRGRGLAESVKSPRVRSGSFPIVAIVSTGS
jgi:hypothetical protein